MAEPIIFTSQIRDVAFGNKVKVVEPSNGYECSIGSNSFVGPFCEIQKGVIIGERTKVQSHTFICELVSIGNDCFIGHGVRFVNDLFVEGKPAGGNQALWKETKIGNNVSVGSGAVLLPVEICNNVVIGAGAVVTKNITQPGVYAGNPAKYLRAI